MNTEKYLKKQIVKSANAVKKKVKMMQNLKTDNENILESVFKPITQPLNMMVKKNSLNEEKSNMDSEIKQNDSNESQSFETIKANESNTESSDDASESDVNEANISASSFKSVDSTNSNSAWSLSSDIFENVPFGVRLDRGILKLGESRVSVTNNTITVGRQPYDKTPGLNELLFKKMPDMTLLTEEDLSKYKQILMYTNAHRRDFDPKKPIKSNKGFKYLHVIKPLFKLCRHHSSTESLTQGSGLPLLKKIKENVDYVYWDDPNELVERLKLLLASRDAGNTGLENEIISIIEELRENSIIS